MSEITATYNEDEPFWIVYQEGEENMRNIISVNITVSKNELLAKLKENRNKHIKDYEEAFRGYRNLVIKKLRERAEEIELASGISERRPDDWARFNLHAPQNHERDYSQLIEMLEMALETEFEISGAQFRQWVQDEWDWRDDFEKSKTIYSVHS